MGLSVWQIAIIALVILVLFGRGRISEMMGDFGKGISSFKKGMNEADSTSSKPAERLEGPGAESSPKSDLSQDPQPAPRSDTPDQRG